jgi:hypothetical protein
LKRYVPRLLAAYAVAMTLIAAWLGCRAYVYGRLLGAYSTNSPADHAQIIANWNAPLHLKASLDTPAMLFASLEPANLAAAVFVIFLAFLALAPKKRSPQTSNHSPEDRPACPS